MGRAMSEGLMPPVSKTGRSDPHDSPPTRHDEPNWPIYAMSGRLRTNIFEGAKGRRLSPDLGGPCSVARIE
jgi:hypothetical protein